jgi:hypothetical protein
LKAIIGSNINRTNEPFNLYYVSNLLPDDMNLNMIQSGGLIYLLLEFTKNKNNSMYTTNGIVTTNALSINFLNIMYSGADYQNNVITKQKLIEELSKIKNDIKLTKGFEESPLFQAMGLL